MRCTVSFVLITALAFPALALAANVHLVGKTTSTIENRQLTLCGNLAGLGNGNVTIRVRASTVTTCTNRGNKTPPGQTQVLEGQVTNVRTENGNVRFCVTTEAAKDVCPGKMTPNVTLKNVQLTVLQRGKVVLQQAVNPSTVTVR